MIVYDVVNSSDARDEALRLQRSSVVAILSGTWYRIYATGGVRQLSAEKAREIEDKINDGSHTVQRLPL